MKDFALILMSLLMVCCTKDNEVKAATVQEAGKHVALIVSSHSSGISGVVADAERLVKNVTWMGDALHINASNHSNRASLIQNWLPTLNFASGTTAINSTRPADKTDGAHEIESPVLLIHGEKAHSRYFSEYAFEKMTGKHVEGQSAIVGNKELMIIPDAVHTDLYDDKNGKIPYDKIEAFFRENLK